MLDCIEYDLMLGFIASWFGKERVLCLADCDVVLLLVYWVVCFLV